MSIDCHDHLPDPSREAVNTWLRRLSLEYLHGPGWKEVNKRAHALVMGGRKLANEHYSDDPVAREGFYAGMTYGLLGNVHFGDIEQLTGMMAATDTPLETVEQAEQLEIPIGESTTGGDGGGEGLQPAA